MKNMPGFISASIHKSFDGHKVINYAQWRSREDFEAMTKHPDAIPHMKAAAGLAKFEPIPCEVLVRSASSRNGVSPTADLSGPGCKRFPPRSASPEPLPSVEAAMQATAIRISI